MRENNENYVVSKAHLLKPVEHSVNTKVCCNL